MSLCNSFLIDIKMATLLGYSGIFHKVKIALDKHIVQRVYFKYYKTPNWNGIK